METVQKLMTGKKDLHFVCSHAGHQCRYNTVKREPLRYVTAGNVERARQKMERQAGFADASNTRIKAGCTWRSAQAFLAFPAEAKLPCRAFYVQGLVSGSSPDELAELKLAETGAPVAFCSCVRSCTIGSTALSGWMSFLYKCCIKGRLDS